MNAPDAPENFETFYVHFLRSHTRAVTRWMHVAALGAGATGLAVAMTTRRPLPAILGVATGIAFAVGAHPLFEGNVPENGGRPFWAARAFMRMCTRQVTGAIEADMDVANRVRE